MTMFEIPTALWPIIRKSWKERNPDLMGRFDLAWDGTGPPKMLEYNADTPSVLVESGKSQLSWKEEVHPEHGQCNFIDNALIASFNSIKNKLGISSLGILCV
jgi:glutathionylspermidine synthase